MESKINIVDKQKDSITFEIMNYDNTLLRPLVEEILKDEQVTESRYFIKHPVIDNPRVYVKVKSGKPQAAVKRSIKRLSKVFEGLSTELNKELKKDTYPEENQGKAN
ncbi:MAG: DNA-directed RNA polymerase subunit L [Candidatus Thermoplasmatota archaeon]|jgi:DNA-directed RNA polymerase subunit L|nr:DNA-directed RNA polymerase subunit L [Candidatus Thermoplasmatota archaeon]MCL5988551.1 DNA-directed RNA polymerase subunit L [Candidatus Thermoplasmatota archaeon]